MILIRFYIDCEMVYETTAESDTVLQPLIDTCKIKYRYKYWYYIKQKIHPELTLWQDQKKTA